MRQPAPIDPRSLADGPHRPHPPLPARPPLAREAPSRDPLDEIAAAAVIHPRVDNRPSAWWYVAASFLIGSVVLLGIHHVREFLESEPLARLMAKFDFFHPSEPSDSEALAQEVKRLRDRLSRVEERQRRMSRSHDIVD